jgi:hypothetical protein
MTSDIGSAHKGGMLRRPAYWTHDDEAATDTGHLYYFAPTERAPPPYTRQIEVEAIIDIADDGTLAGVELIYDMPPPPTAEGDSRSAVCVSTREGAVAMAIPMHCSPVRISFRERDDGGLRIWSDDIPGLILSGADPSAVWRDLGPAIEVLLRRNSDLIHQEPA